jgi:hypothetical protein
MIEARTLASVLLAGTLLSAGHPQSELRTFFTEQMGLSDEQITTLASGGAVVKVLPSERPEEIVVFGVVFVNTAPEEYAELAFDMDRLRRLPGYLGAGRISEPPLLSDLEGFTLEPADIKQLRTCRPGKCGVQLPAEAMREIQESLDWSSRDVAIQVNARIRRIAFEILERYRKDGNRALGIYRDKDRPFDVDEQLQSLLGRSAALPVYLPDLNRYLLDYPNITLADVESLFYWEKVNFGMKPTLRLNHAIAYRSAGPRGVAQVVAVKQLYASHYFQLALDLSACVTENGRTGGPGFYLISLKGSTQQGLTGFRGSILRRILVGRIRSAQERALLDVKSKLEEKR